MDQLITVDRWLLFDRDVVCKDECVIHRIGTASGGLVVLGSLTASPSGTMVSLR